MIPHLVSSEKNQVLSSIPKDDEIFKAVCALGGDKAPGLDGFPCSSSKNFGILLERMFVMLLRNSMVLKRC